LLKYFILKFLIKLFNTTLIYIVLIQLFIYFFDKDFILFTKKQVFEIKINNEFLHQYYCNLKKLKDM